MRCRCGLTRSGGLSPWVPIKRSPHKLDEAACSDADPNVVFDCDAQRNSAWRDDLPNVMAAESHPLLQVVGPGQILLTLTSNERRPSVTDRLSSCIRPIEVAFCRNEAPKS